MADLMLEHSPKYARLAEELRLQIRSGELAPGAALPSFAQMRLRGGVSQDTLTKAHDLLQREGLIVRERGRGVFVARGGDSGGNTSKAGDAKNRLVGVLGCSDTRHPYWSELMGAAHAAAQEHGFNLLLCGADPEQASRCAGLLVLNGSAVAPEIAGLPRVNLLGGGDEAPLVALDEGGGVRLLVRHLVDLGHRRIAYLHLGEWGVRFAAWRDAMREAGIEPKEAWARRVIPGVYSRSIGFEGHGYASMAAWLDDNFLDLGCTALLVHNDDAAQGALRALAAAEVRVPGDISVVGFDGQDWVRRLTPPLTSLRVPLREMGALAVELLLEVVGGAAATSNPRPFAGELFPGGSTAPPTKTSGHAAEPERFNG